MVLPEAPPPPQAPPVAAFAAAIASSPKTPLQRTSGKKTVFHDRDAEGEGDGDEKGTPWKRTQSARGSVCQTRQRLRPWLTNCQKCVAPLSTFERYGWAIGTTKIK